MSGIFSRSQFGTRQLLRVVPIAVIAYLLIDISLMLRPAFGPVGFWPATALLAGMLLCLPRKHQCPAWLMLVPGVLLAYGLWYHNAASGLVNTAVDLSGVFVAWFLLARVWRLEHLRTYQAITKILVASLAASASTALAGLLVHIWPQAPLRTATEVLLRQWLGYSTLLPVCLLWFTSLSKYIQHDRRHHRTHLIKDVQFVRTPWPILLLILAVALAIGLGGPGAIAFPIPALLLCAYAYQQQTTAWLTLAAVMGVMFADSQEWGLVLPNEGSILNQISLQIGLQLMVATPLLVSGSLAARNDLVLALNQALDHDDLTHALARQAFIRGATEYLQQSPAAPHGNGVIMMDIDHFKTLNDSHGHAAGDSVLREFSRVVHEAIRPNDLFGRLGGEEFSLILPDTPPEDCLQVAERLRHRIESIRLYHDSDEPLQITVSIGVVHDHLLPEASLSTLLSTADQVMYMAKNNGRNQVKHLMPGQMRDLNPVPMM